MMNWNPVLRWLTACAVALGLGVGAAVAHDRHGSHPGDHHAEARDGSAYPVSGFHVVAITASDHAEIQSLPELRLTLGQVATGFVEPRDGVPQTEVQLRSAPFSNYYGSALRAIRLQLTEHLVDEGFAGVLVYPAGEHIDPETRRDLRPVGQVGLNLLVRTDGKPKRGWFR